MTEVTANAYIFRVFILGRVMLLILRIHSTSSQLNANAYSYSMFKVLSLLFSIRPKFILQHMRATTYRLTLARQRIICLTRVHEIRPVPRLMRWKTCTNPGLDNVRQEV